MKLVSTPVDNVYKLELSRGDRVFISSGENERVQVAYGDNGAPAPEVQGEAEVVSVSREV